MNPDWPEALSRIASDPLDVLKSTAAVMASASDVQIDMGMVNDVADQLSDRTPNQEWDAALHYRATGPDGDEQTAMWILILDALNFCFWGQGANPEQRWRIEWQGELADGYMALVAALKRGVVERQELLSASWLANVSREKTLRTSCDPLRGRKRFRSSSHGCSTCGNLAADSSISEARHRLPR